MIDRSPSASDEERTRALALIEKQPRRDETSVVDWLERLCRALADDLELRGAAVSLSTGSGAGDSVAAASDPASSVMAGLPFAVGEGPACDALADGRPVLVPELGGRLHGTWPGYTSAARALGVEAVFCFPLQVGFSRFGVLSVFSTQTTHLDEQSLGRCLAMAELATERLLDSIGGRGDIEPDLESALSLHSEIYQAQGMVAVALDVTLEQSLARIRAHAFQADRPLLEVAVDIIAGRLRLPDDRPPT